MRYLNHKHARGFTMFFAVLVSSLALAIGLAIYDLVFRELQLSTTNEQSQYAIYAADTAAECALYWDFKYTYPTANSSYFPTSTSDLVSGASDPAACGGANITRTFVSSTATAATTTFTMNVGARSYSMVEVVKNYVGTTQKTAIYSHGYNTTNISSPNAVERIFQVTY